MLTNPVKHSFADKPQPQKALQRWSYKNSAAASRQQIWQCGELNITPTMGRNIVVAHKSWCVATERRGNNYCETHSYCTYIDLLLHALRVPRFSPASRSGKRCPALHIAPLRHSNDFQSPWRGTLACCEN